MDLGEILVLVQGNFYEGWNRCCLTQVMVRHVANERMIASGGWNGASHFAGVLASGKSKFRTVAKKYFMANIV